LFDLEATLRLLGELNMFILQFSCDQNPQNDQNPLFFDYDDSFGSIGGFGHDDKL